MKEGEKINNDQLTFKGQNTCKGAKIKPQNVHEERWKKFYLGGGR
jgi:hypothetical protein